MKKTQAGYDSMTGDDRTATGQGSVLCLTTPCLAKNI